MEGYIDEYGRLWIKRKNKFVQAECRAAGSTISFCDHRCSRFGEPYEGPIYKEKLDGNIKGTDLDLCGKTLNFRIFRDMRSD